METIKNMQLKYNIKSYIYIQNYGWDDTKRIEKALFSLWSLLKRKISETDLKSNK